MTVQGIFDFAVPLLGKATFNGMSEQSSFRASGGCNEWYTPENVVEIARETMGGIDLDPASCSDANRVVCAERYYDESDNGLVQEWSGRVFLNPPFGGRVMGDNGKSVRIKTAFVSKLVKHYVAGDVEQACLVCSTDISSAWGDPIRGYASAICVAHRRMDFWNMEEKKYVKSGTSGMIAYFGDAVGRFIGACRRSGVGQPYINCL